MRRSHRQKGNLEARECLEISDGKQVVGPGSKDYSEAFEGKEVVFEGKEIVVPSGLEQDPPQDKQVYRDEGDGKYPYQAITRPPVVEFPQPSVLSPKTNPRKKWYFIAIVIVIVMVAICHHEIQFQRPDAVRPASQCYNSSFNHHLENFRKFIEGDSWWLFYVDNANVIQDVYSKKDLTEWRKGTVGSNGYKVPNDTNIAFTASRGRRYNSTLNGIDGGLSLYATGTNGTIQEYLFDDQDGSWTDGFNFPGTDGSAGASTWSFYSYAYIYTMSSSGSLEFWYRDYNPMSSINNNRWQLGPSSHADFVQNGSVCGQFGVAFQSSNGMIRGSNFTNLEKPSQVRWDTLYDISDQPAIDKSAVSCWYSFSREEAKRNVQFQIFYQTDGRKITEAAKLWGPDNNTFPGTWTYNDVPINP
ncbi:MAG: hypothetical protein Q9218_003338 [Villophora microphyllina]